jgi:leader peptidase (prepilin peptidase)/N-methyltransferase
LVVISVYDLKHKIIPDLAVFVFIAVSLCANLLTYGYNFFGFNFLIGPILFAFFALIWLVSQGKWMGFGDAKLVLGIGFLLGFTDSIFSMLIAFWVGAIVGIIVLAFHAGSITIKYEIPFAPFLVLGTLVALLTSFNVLYHLALTL